MNTGSSNFILSEIYMLYRDSSQRTGVEMMHSSVDTPPSAHPTGSYTMCESAASMVVVLGLVFSALKQW